jgi:hypothetical protein
MFSVLKFILFYVMVLASLSGEANQASWQEEVRFGGHGFHGDEPGEPGFHSYGGGHYGGGGGDVIQGISDLWHWMVHFWQMLLRNPILALASTGLGLFIGFCFFKPFFSDRSGFWDCLTGNDAWASTKLCGWFGLSMGTMIFAFYQLPSMFPHVFPKPV